MDVRQKAIQLIGQEIVDELEQHGITLAPRIRPPTYNRYVIGSMQSLGKVKWHHDEQEYDYIAIDEHGYEIALSEYSGFLFSVWIGRNEATEIIIKEETEHE